MSESDAAKDSIGSNDAQDRLGPNEPPLIKTVEEYNGPMFTREVLEQFARDRKEDYIAVVRRAAAWEFYRSTNPSLPAITDLTSFDIPAILLIRQIDEDETWEDFSKRCGQKLERRYDEANPWLPAWILKSPDKPHSWIRSIEGTPLETNDTAQNKFNSLIRDACPFGGGSATVPGAMSLGLAQSAIGAAPTEDHETLREIITNLTKLGRYWLMPLGADHLDIEFRFGKPLCLLAGLGYEAIRIVAATAMEFHEGWDYWKNCTDDQLRESIMKARQIHGYPIGLLRTDGVKVSQFLNNFTSAPGDWFTPLIYLHILKYARFTWKGHASNNQPVIQIIRDGACNVFPVDPQCAKQTFDSSSNIALRNDVLKALGLPYTLQKGRAAFNDVVHAVLRTIGTMRPSSLCMLRPLDTRVDLAVASAVELVPLLKVNTDYMFIDPGMGVRNVARIDYETGTVEHEKMLTGSDVGTLRWPEGELDVVDLETWKSCLPTTVEPTYPSDVVFKYIKNVNDLGFPRAMRAAFDSFMMIALFRRQFAGSDFGNSLPREFPFAMIMPMGATKEETTNQGKTNLARIMMNAICPGVEPVYATRSSSPPAMRIAARPLEEFGTALYDEFQLPSSQDHFLSQAGLQALATGTGSGPGRVMENSTAIKLRHSMIICTKVCAFPPDVQNRSFFFFLDTLSDATRCSDEELRIISTSVAGNTVRMNALAWAYQTNFVEKVKTLKPKGSKHMRFASFLALSIAFCRARGGNEQEMFDFLDACQARCRDQHSKASASGLTDEIGATSEFNASYWFKECSNYTLDQIEKPGKLWTSADMMREIIEDNNMRKYRDVLRDYNVKEATVNIRFGVAVRDGLMVRPGWKIESQLPPTQSLRDRGYKYYKVVRVTEPGDVETPTIESLEKNIAKGLARDSVKDVKDAAAHPEQHLTDKPKDRSKNSK